MLRRWWLFRRERSVLRERIFIFFSGSGVIYILFVISVFFAHRFRGGGGGLSYVLGLTLLVVGLVGMIQTNENLRGLFVIHMEVDPVPVGDIARVRIAVVNRSSNLRQALLLRFAQRGVWRKTQPLSQLGTQASSVVVAELPTHKRGVFPFPPVLLSSVFPLGICFAWKHFVLMDKGCGLVVYPAPRGSPLFERTMGNGVRPGRVLSRGLDDVSGHRPYQSGDSPNRLDWRVFARTRELLVRTLESGGRDGVLLSWADTEFLEDHEDRLCQLSRWIDDCVQEGVAFRLDLPKATGTVLSHLHVNLCRTALALLDRDDKG